MRVTKERRIPTDFYIKRVHAPLPPLIEALHQILEK